MKMLWLRFCRNRGGHVPPPNLIQLAFFISAACLIGVIVFGLVPGIRLSVPIPRAAIAKEEGFAYLTVLPRPGFWQLASLGDHASSSRQSTTQLFENDQRLGPAHSLHEVIRSAGQGRF